MAASGAIGQRAFAAAIVAFVVLALAAPSLGQRTPSYWQSEWDSCFNITGVIQLGALHLIPEVEIEENRAYTGLYKSESGSQLKGLEFWLRTVNKNCSGIWIDGNHYLFNLTLVNIGETTTKNRNRTATAMTSFPNINLWIGPYASGTTVTVADAVEKAVSPKVLIGTGATSSSLFICPSNAPSGCEPGARRFSRLFSPLSIAERYYVPAVNIFRTKGAKTVAIVYETSAFGTSLAVGSKAEAINNKLNVTLEKTCPPTPNAGNISALVDAIIETKPDVVVCGLYYAASVEMIKQFKARNYMPKAFASRMGDVALFADLGKDSAYAIDSNYWDYRLRGDDYIDNLYFPPTPNSEPAPKRWHDSFTAVMGFQPGSNYEGVAFAAAQVLHRAIERARSWDPVRVQQALSQLQFTSFWGKITFNGFGYNELYPFAQVQYNEMALPEIIYPLIASTQDSVYPIPLWEERSQRLYPYWQPSEKAIVGIAGIFIILTLGLMIFVAVLSNRHRVIKAASPPFLLLFLFGSLLLYTAVIMWSLYVPTAVCNAVAWCLSVGFVVMFGSLFGRTFRILQIIQKSKYAPVKFTNKRLFIFVSLLVAIDVIVLIIWTSVVPIRGVLIQPDRYRPLQDIIQCELQNSDYIFIGILGAYKLLIMIAGLFFSVKIWNFRMSEFNESKPIAFGQYNLIFFMILAIVAVAVFDPVSQRIASYVVRSVAIMLATIITVLVIMVPKIYAVYKIPPGTESSRRPKISGLMSGLQTNTGTGTGSGSHLSSHTQSKSFSSMSESELEARLSRMAKDLERVKSENKRLEAENSKLKKQLALKTADEESTESSSSSSAEEEQKNQKKAADADDDDAASSVETEPSSSEEEEKQEEKKQKKKSKKADSSKASSKKAEDIDSPKSKSKKSKEVESKPETSPAVEDSDDSSSSSSEKKPTKKKTSSSKKST